MTEENQEEDHLPKEESLEGMNVNELQTLSEGLRDYKEKYLRLLAESENARKRMQKERQELTRYAVQNVISDFLNPLDHFEKALGFAEHASPEVKNWAIGFEMILSQFKEALSNQGVSSYECVGMHFDPHLHEAVEMIETTDAPPGVIIEECIKGYKMGDKTIRVARVKVAKAPSPKNQNSEENQLNEGENND